MGLTLTAGRAGRLIYGALFMLVLPLALVVWARALEGIVAPPPIRAPIAGASVVAVGVAIWLAGVIAIVHRGHGLPMNAFPPPVYVSSGIYTWFAHPIYVGWTLACAGLALAYGSATGLWIVTPSVALGCLALVLGYERHDLRRRFGRAAMVKPRFGLPPNDDVTPSASERLALWLVVGLPWIATFAAVKALGAPRDAFDARFAFEKTWPVWLWTVPIYASAYLVIPLAAFAAPTRSHLRRYAMQGLVATGVITLIYLIVPVIAPARVAPTSGMLGGLLAFDRALDSPPVGACPAFHVVWAAFAAEALASRSRAWAVAGWIWAVAVTLSCITTGMHGIADVVAAIVVWIPLRRPDAVWRRVLDATQRLANSWRSHRVGPVRVMSHGVFAGAAAAVGVAGIATLAGSASLPSVLTIAISTLVGAGLWAQLVEGSPALLRPLGYYGAVAGGLLGAGIVAASGGPAAVLIAATATVAPFVQAIGRLRCLVQGCCHGGETDPRLGIRVSNPHSRVVALAHLDGRPIHPTQLYSIAGNVVIGLLLWRGWTLGLSAWFLGGAYGLLAGFARFIEEGFRDEPQTITWRGLPIYQHLALASIALGAWMTTWGGPAVPAPAWPSASAAIAAMAVGLLYWFAMGVDFPESSRRFARLSG